MNFEREEAVMRIARMMETKCSEHGRFAIAGPYAGVIAVHYSRHQGWVWFHAIPGDLEKYRDFGAEYLVLVLNRDVLPADREQYRKIATEWPILEHGIERWDTKGRELEYYILDLRRSDSAGPRVP